MPFETHRKSIFSLMDMNSVLFLESASIKVRSNDTHFPYRQDSNLYYATGFLESDAILVMVKSESLQESILFVHPKDPLKELWEGKVLGVDAACEHLKVDKAYSIETFEDTLKTLLKGMTILYCSLSSSRRSTIEKWVNKARTSKEYFAHIESFKEVETLFYTLRKVKSAWEIENIRKALEITKKAHHMAMAMSDPNVHEFQVMAAIEYMFKTNGASGDAYTTIVASGNNANTLHYIENDHMLRNGDLVLLDAGAEYSLYASDITRTYPVNGRFSGPQKELYTIVLEAQKAAFAQIRPGGFRSKINEAAVKVLTQGLIDLKILKESLDTSIEKELYKPYYPHGIGHWMGLDVHDPLAYKASNGDELPFIEGEVLTIEPGLYLDQNNSEVPKAFQGLGIRIEDDILVTKEGYENLSYGIAKEIHEVEQACQKSLYDFI